MGLQDLMYELERLGHDKTNVIGPNGTVWIRPTFKPWLHRSLSALLRDAAPPAELHDEGDLFSTRGLETKSDFEMCTVDVMEGKRGAGPSGGLLMPCSVCAGSGCLLLDACPLCDG